MEAFEKKRIRLCAAVLAGLLLGGCASSGTEDPEEAAAAQAALQEQLSDGEYVLSSSVSDDDFESEAPDFLPSFSEDAVLYFYMPDAGIGLEVSEDESECFLDTGNEADLSDPNTVLHISDNSVLVYGDTDFFEESPYFYVYSADEIFEYRVFASYTSDAEDILLVHNCYSYADFVSYIDEIYAENGMDVYLNKNLYDEVLSVLKILTIQYSLSDDEDFIVHAVLTGRESY